MPLLPFFEHHSVMRCYNFSAGPSALATEVLLEVQQELLDWQGLGLSAMEISHRSAPFMALYEQLQHDFRELLAIPAEYQVIFSTGGAAAHFAFAPLNLLGDHTGADYVISGAWSDKAYQEARRYGHMHVAASSESQGFWRLPEPTTWHLSKKAAYCHLVSNETIHGVQFTGFPRLDRPLLVDMSSDILSRPIEIQAFGMIYAGAQKNIGPAGLTVLIVHRDLLGRAHPLTPTVFNYTQQSQQQSMANTPPTFAWYLTAKVLQHLKAQGGLSIIEQRNRAKAQCLYEYLDRSRLFHTPVDPACRSMMNVPFFLPSEHLTQLFLQHAESKHLLGLKGHRLIGGLRASLYNSVPLEAVHALVAFMAEFEREVASDINVAPT